MNNPGSHRYPVQPHDPTLAQQYYHRPSASTSASTSTSTASAYAYAQQAQQQQNRQSQQSHYSYSSSSSGPGTAYPYIPPQIQRQQPAQQSRRAPSILKDRPHSIDELARLATLDKYDRHIDIKQDLRYAEVYLSEGKRDLEAGDLEWAFVNFARTATLVLNKIPTNSGYRTMKQAHRDAVASNGNFCLEKLDELKPKLVDRHGLWMQRNPNTKADFDIPRILNAMAARDQEELAIRAQLNKEKRATSKEEAARRTQAEEERTRTTQAMPPRLEAQLPDHDEESRRRREADRQAADRKAYEDARRRQDEARRKEAEEKARAAAEAALASHHAVEDAKRAELERRRRDAEEEGRRREDEISRRKQEAARREQEAATYRKTEDLEYRRKMEEARRREQDGIVQRQREFEAEAHATKNSLRPPIPQISVPPPGPSSIQVSMPVPTLIPPSTTSSRTSALSQTLVPSLPSSASSSGFSSLNKTLVSPEPPSSDSSSNSSAMTSSSNSSNTQTQTPRQQDALPILPLESPTHANGDDPRAGRHHPQPQHAVTEKPSSRKNSYHTLITTTSPPPGGRPVTMQFPSLMTEHQRTQGYTPSLQSMFSPPIGALVQDGLLFRPNPPEGPSMKNMPSSPDRPPAHIRHMWEQAGYGYQYSNSKPHGNPPARSAPGDSRIFRPEDVRDDAATVIGKELRIVKVPQHILPRFLAVAAVNTTRNRETCGLLMGRENGKEYKVTTLLIPKQRATSDTCTMDEEELVSEFAEKRNMLTLGWIHTHPTQSCFMSSLDLHTHAGFQCTLPEFFAIVCAPKHVPDCGIFRLTDPPGLKTILKCTEKAAFHPHPERPIYTDADKGHVVWVEDAPLEIVDLR